MFQYMTFKMLGHTQYIKSLETGGHAEEIENFKRKLKSLTQKLESI